MLAAIRVSQPGPDGIVIGPVAFVGGRNLRFSAVKDQDMKLRLLDTVKRAPSCAFAQGVTWRMPENVRKESGSKKPVGRKK
jgi:hypothetical protein